MNLTWLDLQLLDDDYAVGEVRFDRSASGHSDDPWIWDMQADSRFSRVMDTRGSSRTAAEAKASLIRAYETHCSVPGAREDFFAKLAASQADQRAFRI